MKVFQPVSKCWRFDANHCNEQLNKLNEVIINWETVFQIKWTVVILQTKNYVLLEMSYSKTRESALVRKLWMTSFARPLKYPLDSICTFRFFSSVEALAPLNVRIISETCNERNIYIVCHVFSTSV